MNDFTVRKSHGRLTLLAPPVLSPLVIRPPPQALEVEFDYFQQEVENPCPITGPASYVDNY